MKNTELLIIEQLKWGNEEAYRYIYDNHYVFLCYVANQYLEDDFLSETIVGDVIFHIWEIRETLNISTSLRSYLVRAVRNRCIDYLKSKRERIEVPLSTLSSTDISDVTNIGYENAILGKIFEHELEHEILAAISKLPDECRCVFEKSRFEGKKYDEISEELGISVNTVKYHIKKALSILWNEISPYLMYFLLFGTLFL